MYEWERSWSQTRSGNQKPGIIINSLVGKAVETKNNKNWVYK